MKDRIKELYKNDPRLAAEIASTLGYKIRAKTVKLDDKTLLNNIEQEKLGAMITDSLISNGQDLESVRKNVKSIATAIASGAQKRLKALAKNMGSKVESSVKEIKPLLRLYKDLHKAFVDLGYTIGAEVDRKTVEQHLMLVKINRYLERMFQDVINFKMIDGGKGINLIVKMFNGIAEEFSTIEKNVAGLDSEVKKALRGDLGKVKNQLKKFNGEMDRLKAAVDKFIKENL